MTYATTKPSTGYGETILGSECREPASRQYRKSPMEESIIGDYRPTHGGGSYSGDQSNMIQV